MSKKKDLIIVVVDRSGSMAEMKEEAITGYNKFIEEQRDVERDADVSLVLFNDEVFNKYNRKPIAEVPDMTDEDYDPCGTTALLDAMGESISRHEHQDEYYFGNNPDYDKVVFCVITDGKENASSNYSKETVQEWIQKTDDWEYVFLAANMDQIREAEDYGIKTSSISGYDNTREGTVQAFADMSGQARELREE